MTESRFSKSWQKLLVLIMMSLSYCAFTVLTCFSANVPMPGEEKSGFFYTITHFSLFAYGVLFLIFCLSVINLWLQFRLNRGWTWPTRLLSRISPLSTIIRPIATPSGKRARHHIHHASNACSNPDSADDGIVAVRAITKDGAQTVLFPPTPLDGADHPLPKFGSFPEGELSEENLLVINDSDIPDSPPNREFRFSSAVDILSPAEVERREREGLTVSGTVIGPDGKPLEYAVVYLADSEGNKVGQSCRSNPESGSFRVLVHDAGAYSLHVYKRGFAMAGNRPLTVPAESGKIEGLEINMVSQGCMIYGRTMVQDEFTPVHDININCVCKSSGFVESSKTDNNGQFRLFNAPMNSECYLEAVDMAGNVLGRTDPFETVQKKQIYKDVTIAAVQPATEGNSSEVLNPFIEPKNEDRINDDVVAVSGP
ncbi:MAG: carboxypeptidase-like regulatory domain-containing protein [Desulfomonilaceae bacterium]